MKDDGREAESVAWHEFGLCEERSSAPKIKKGKRRGRGDGVSTHESFIVSNPIFESEA